MVSVLLPGREQPFIAGARLSVVDRVRELWGRLYQLADQIDETESLMERQAAWICRYRDREDLWKYQSKWSVNDERRLYLHAQVEQLIYKADVAMRKATDEDKKELGLYLSDGGNGMAMWFTAFVPKRDITASWCPESVSCDGHVF